MKTAYLNLLSMVCVAVPLAASAGCSDDASSSGDERGPTAGPDSGDVPDAGAGDPSPEDASTDVVSERRPPWDGGEVGPKPVVLEMWTRPYVYCARVKRAESSNIECWGNNSYGELGRGEVTPMATVQAPYPIQSPDAPRFRAIRTDGSLRGIICALTDTDDMRCWGAKYSTAVGGGGNPNVPTEPFLTGVTDASLAGNHGCARLNDGHIRCWGANSYGQLGTGTTDYQVRDDPREVPNFTADAVSTGGSTTCALKDGEVYCWGLRSLTGNGSAFGNILVPTKVAGLSGVTKLQAGQSTFALASDKTLWYWGSLGNKTSYVPTKVLDPTPSEPNRVLTDVEDISGGCVLLSGGRVKCLPSPLNGAYSFNEIPRLEDTVRLSGACALDSKGTLRCWGDNFAGVLGIPVDQLSSTTSPIEIKF